jgi:hypothetical protein
MRVSDAKAPELVSKWLLVIVKEICETRSGGSNQWR